MNYPPSMPIELNNNIFEEQRHREEEERRRTEEFERYYRVRDGHRPHLG